MLRCRAGISATGRRPRICAASLRAAARTGRRGAGASRLEKHPDKTFIGRIERGFDVLGDPFSRDGLTVAKATIEKFVARATRLYQQDRKEPSGLSRLGICVRR